MIPPNIDSYYEDIAICCKYEFSIGCAIGKVNVLTFMISLFFNDKC